MGGGGWRYPSPQRPAPVPTQERALDTVNAAIEATVQLLERDPEPHVTLEAIRLRSGVSQGSLTHHFGSRDGLIAAAHVERYRRSCEADRAFLRQLDGVLAGPETTVATLLAMLDAMLGEDRRAGRWMRLSAIAAAFTDGDLTATLSETYTGLVDELTAIIGQAHASGTLRSDADVRTTALLLTMQAQGLVLDDLIGGDVEQSTWNHMQARFAATFVTPEVGAQLISDSDRRFGELWRVEVRRRPCEVPHDVAARLAALHRDAGHEDPDGERPETGADEATFLRLLRSALAPGRGPGPGRRSASADDRTRLVAAAVSALREQGQRGVDVARIRADVGVSAQAFHRIIGTRDDLVREARIELEVGRSARAIALLAAMIAGCGSPAEMRHALLGGALRISERPALDAMWQRIETIAATRTDPRLRAALGRLQRVARDLVIAQICHAQRRGLIDETLPATGVARLLEGSMFWHVFHGLDAERPPREAWTGMLARIAELISPDR